MIDTLKLSNRLTDAGMPPEQARAITEEISAGLKESAATRTDLELMEGRLTNKLYGTGLTVVIALGIIQHFFK
jgi:hypothetical protein